MVRRDYVYVAEIIEIIDGDTIKAKIDLGFNLSFVEKIRFYGINAPELTKTVESKKVVNDSGAESLKRLKDMLFVGQKITIETIKDKKEKYGRYLANIYVDAADGQICINKWMLENNLAKEYKD